MSDTRPSHADTPTTSTFAPVAFPPVAFPPAAFPPAAWPGVLGASAPERQRPQPETFLFGPFQLMPGRQLLLRDGRAVSIGSRALLLLTELVRNAGRMVGRNQLMDAAWPDTFVDDSNLRAQIANLRRALGDGRDGLRLVVNVHGRGYQLVEPVHCLGAPGALAG